MAEILLTAEASGLEPGFALAHILPHLRDAVLSYLGASSTLKGQSQRPEYGGRVAACAVTDKTFVERCRKADALISVQDYAAARAAEEAGIPFAVLDTRAEPHLKTPDIARRAGLYVCANSTGVCDRLAREGFENAIVVPQPKPGVSTRDHPWDGALNAGKVLTRWIKDPPAKSLRLAPAGPRIEFPKVGPLTMPASNRGGPEEVAAIRKLHYEIDGTGFNTLATTLELVCEARKCGSFTAAQANFRRDGAEIFEKYRGGHCTALAEVLRDAVQRETGFTGRIITVRYADSKFPLDFEWKYDGTVHTDVVFPYREQGACRAVHVVNGMGTDDHFHEFDSLEGLLDHLRDLRYLLAEVADPAELTTRAFGCKNKLWIKRSKEDRFCVDVVKAETYIANQESHPLKACGRSLDFWERIAERYQQPEDFVQNLEYLATHLDAYRDILCEPARSMR